MRQRFKTLAILVLLIGLISPAAIAADTGATDAQVTPAAKVATAAAQPATAAPEAVAPAAAAAAAEAAPAPAESVQSWWQALLVQVIQITGAIFVPVLSLLAVWLLRKIGIKVGVEQMGTLAAKGWAYAEHKASVALKDGQPKADSAKKMEWAFDLIKSIDEKAGGSEKVRKKLTGMLMAKIGEEEQKEKAKDDAGSPKEDNADGTA